MLNVENLNKSYGNKNKKKNVLKNIRFSIDEGEFVAIMGPSGAGKSTLLNILAGFIPPDSGKVVLREKDILSMNKSEMSNLRNRDMGFVFQDFMLLDGLSVFENICVPQIISKEDEQSMESRAEELCRSFGLSSIKESFPMEISGGEKQRTSIARALINSPYVILADEPTGNLDSESGKKVIDAFIRAKEDFHSTILMVTHDCHAASFCDRVILLKDGIISKTLKRDGHSKNFMNHLLDSLKTLDGGAQNEHFSTK